KAVDRPESLHDRGRGRKRRPMPEPLLHDGPRNALVRRMLQHESLKLHQRGLICPDTCGPQSQVPEVLADDREVGSWPFGHWLASIGTSSPTVRNSDV